MDRRVYFEDTELALQGLDMICYYLTVEEAEELLTKLGFSLEVIDLLYDVCMSRFYGVDP
jgi:hypothetical protein